MATLEQRQAKDGTRSWRVWWRNGRGSKKQSATFYSQQQAASAKTLAEARGHNITREEVYAAVLGIDLDADNAKPPPTVAEWAGQWVAERKQIGDVQPDTLVDYQRILMRRILPKLGTLPLTGVTREVVQGWIAWLRTQRTRSGAPLSAQTVRRAHGVLHSLLAAAVPEWFEVNPAARRPGERRNAGLPKTVRYEALFLTKEELGMVVRACPPQIRDLVVTLAGTGLRLGEALALRVEDVAIGAQGRGTIRVRRALKRDGSIGTPKSARSRRDVSLSRELAALLAERISGKPRHALVFPAPRGGFWHSGNLHQRYWQPSIASARRCLKHPPALPPKPRSGPRRKWRSDEVSTCECPTRLHRAPRIHDLRHSHVSWLIEAGWDITRISRRVGHESITTTVDIYGHLWQEEDDTQLDAIDRLLALAEDEAA